MDNLERRLPPLPLQLKKEIIIHAQLHHFQAGTEILKEGQYVKIIPLVIEGLVKVYSSFEDRELLLYYIEPSESCVMSFSAGLWNTPSKVYAIAERDSKVLAVPINMIKKWRKDYPAFGELFFQQFNKRYEDLLQTIHQVLFNKMDQRIYDYLKERAKLSGQAKLDIRHHQIARDLGTAREVVSRVIKKLEAEEKLKQHTGFLEIL